MKNKIKIISKEFIESCDKKTLFCYFDVEFKLGFPISWEIYKKDSNYFVCDSCNTKQKPSDYSYMGMNIPSHIQKNDESIKDLYDEIFKNNLNLRELVVDFKLVDGTIGTINNVYAEMKFESETNLKKFLLLYSY